MLDIAYRLKKFKNFWVISIFILIVLQGQSWGENIKQNYTVQTDFSCGGVDVKVITHCIYKEKPYLPCLSDSQYIIIRSKKIVSSSTLLKLDHSISEITCYKSKNNKWFIELYYSNLGNCSACEYYELYDINGNLVATDRKKFRVIYKHGSTKVIESKNFNEVVKKYREIFSKLKLEKVSSKDVNLSTESR
ncbi:hypothetical protein [Sulfurihydrogenibium yellowstonense]|uniref:Uncharacterized protein n=1 Tax=Sulfurihydrogenibium yellowstonense SS-5 TaxID=432331 RepID=C4FHH8_9AQUI|nr:hypothetical protein [Sulfurihydrogenibium yellowstonense]EEP61457.1 hypothetical protein SULYE_0006 [Sulfurihydrogenibium yellowstonense SS-5]